jgi:hypothetical protein
MLVMSELPRLRHSIDVDVTVRCRPCHERGRHAPALAALVNLADGWDIWVPERSNTRLARDLGAAQAAEDGKVVALRRHPDGVIVGYLDGRMGWDYLGSSPSEPIPKVIQLGCRQCPHRPRVKRRTLYLEAEQALAEGRRVIYR